VPVAVNSAEIWLLFQGLVCSRARCGASTQGAQAAWARTTQLWLKQCAPALGLACAHGAAQHDTSSQSSRRRTGGVPAHHASLLWPDSSKSLLRSRSAVFSPAAPGQDKQRRRLLSQRRCLLGPSRDATSSRHFHGSSLLACRFCCHGLRLGGNVAIRCVGCRDLPHATPAHLPSYAHQPHTVAQLTRRFIVLHFLLRRCCTGFWVHAVCVFNITRPASH
jgi:hypothetical protein